MIIYKSQIGLCGLILFISFNQKSTHENDIATSWLSHQVKFNPNIYISSFPCTIQLHPFLNKTNVTKTRQQSKNPKTNCNTNRMGNSQHPTTLYTKKSKDKEPNKVLLHLRDGESSSPRLGDVHNILNIRCVLRRMLEGIQLP